MSATILLGALNLWASDVTLVPQGAVWRYDATGTDLGTGWRDPGFNDSGWLSGPAELGYGDNNEKTVLPSSPVFPCYYFRHTFNVDNPARFQKLSLEILRDDGCVVYLNGQEVARYNMPAGTITYATWASSASDYPWDPPVQIPNLLVAGANVLAVEMHQANATSSDISLDARLVGTSTVTLALNSPANGASGVTLPAALSATATSPVGADLDVTFYGREQPAPLPDFTLIMLPDIQKYTAQLLGGTKEIFFSQADWIVANRASLNIAYVSQMGDVSDTGDQDLDESEWINAANGFGRLETALAGDGIPYGLAVGNHDQMVPAGDTNPTKLYNKYFGISHFASKSYFKGSYESGRANNHYDFFSASGLDFIVIYLEYDATPDAAVLTWASELLSNNPGRRGIVVSHYLLETSGAWGVQGQAIYNALKGNSNLFLMLCGHNHGEARRTDVYNGNTVHTILADYQDYLNGGNGYLRILQFSPSNNEIRFQTYSSSLNQYEIDANSQFTLSVPMTTGPAYAVVQQNTAVPSGTATTGLWNGLAPGRSYEWYATANDGFESATSAVRRFTLSANSPPTVAIDLPKDGALFAVGSAVTISATASDTDGSVASMDFFDGLNRFRTLTGAPWSVTFDATAGDHFLTAVAYDNGGAQTASAAVRISVGPPSAPGALQAQVLSASEVQLSWTDNSSSEAEFEIFESQNGGVFAKVGTVGANVTTATVTGLTSTTHYSFKVRAVNIIGPSDYSEPVPVTVPQEPTCPTILSAVAESPTAVLVSWAGDSLNQDGFKVFIVGVVEPVGTTSANATSFLVTGLSASTTYAFTVRAFNSVGSCESAPLTATTPAPLPPPAAPTGLTATPQSTTAILLSWTDNSTDETGFVVERSSDGVAWAQLTTAAANATAMTDTDLTSGVTYYYRVSAYNANGSSLPSNVAEAAPYVDALASGETLVIGTLTGDRTATFTADQVYERITEKLSGAKSTRTSALEHQWTFTVTPGKTMVFSLNAYMAPSADGEQFVFAWSTDNVNYQDMLVVSATAPSADYQTFDLPATLQGTVYIRARDTDRTGGKTGLDALYVDHMFIRTDVSPVMAPPAPPALTAAVAGDKSVTLSWTPSSGADWYNVGRRTLGSGAYAPIASGVTATSYVDTGVVNGTTYEYVVTAHNTFGDSAPSGSLTAKPMLPTATEPPTGLTASGAKRKITLTWVQSVTPGVTENRVYRSADGRTFDLLATIPPATNYSDSVASGSTYSYQVAAVSAAGESAAAGPVTATAK